MSSILEKFKSAAEPKSDAEFYVEALSGSTWYAGRNSSGKATFIVSDAVKPARTIQAGALTMEIGQGLLADSPSGLVQLTGCLILTLGSKDLNHEMYFAEICAALGEQLDKSLTQEEILEQLKILASLFGQKTANRDSVKGFWGELKFLSLFKEPSEIFASWQSGASGRIDFRGSSGGCEVKTVEGIERKHSFGLNQLMGADDLLISIVVEESGEGQSLEGLFQELVPKLSREEAYKLRIRAANFSASALWKQLKFTLQTGHLSPMVFDVKDIPRPHIEEADTDYISAVHFSLKFSAEIRGREILDSGKRNIDEGVRASIVALIT